MSKVLEYLNAVKDTVEQLSGEELFNIVKEHNTKIENEMFDEWYNEKYGKLIESGQQVILLPSNLKQAYLQGCLDTRIRYANSGHLTRALNVQTPEA